MCVCVDTIACDYVYHPQASSPDPQQSLFRRHCFNETVIVIVIHQYLMMMMMMMMMMLVQQFSFLLNDFF